MPSQPSDKMITGLAGPGYRLRSSSSSMEGDVDISCGLWKLRTNLCGRKFANLYVFTVVMSLMTVVSKISHSIISIQMPSIETQFNIDNSKIGLLVTARNAAMISALFWSGHFVKSLHIPLVIGVAALMEGTISCIPAFLQFANPYELANLTSNSSSDSTEKLCVPPPFMNISVNATTPELPKETDRFAFYMLIVVMAVTGLLGVFNHGSLAYVYVDDNILNKSKMSYLFAIQSIIMAVAGPLSSFMNGILTTIPVDLKDTDMSSKDPRFVSAWWIAYLVVGVMIVTMAVPVLLFPRRLISKKRQEEIMKKATITYAGGTVKDEEAEQSVQSSSEDPPEAIPTITGSINDESDPTINYSDEVALLYQSTVEVAGDSLSVECRTKRNKGKNTTEAKKDQKKETFAEKFKRFKVLLRDFPSALLRLFRNPSFVLLMIDISITTIPSSGIGPFKHYYMSYEYGVQMKTVAFYGSVSSIVTGLLGIGISSYISSKVKTKMGFLWIMFGAYCIGTLFSPLYLILGCGNQPVYGLNRTDIGRPVNTSLANCYCPPDSQLLSCGDDNNNYLSPCYAGCKKTDGKIYSDCQLLQGNSSSKTATPGICKVPKKCKRNFVINVVFHGVQGMVETMALIPKNLFLLRLVDPKDRALGLSIGSLVYYAFSLPAPTILGGVLDSMCLVKHGETCRLYDRDSARYLFGGVDISVHSMVHITIILLMIICWRETKKNRRLAEAEKNK